MTKINLPHIKFELQFIFIIRKYYYYTLKNKLMCDDKTNKIDKNRPF